jgi:hypothetical protein
MEPISDLRYDTYPALFMNASAAIADSPLRQRLTAGVLVPQSLDVLFQVRLGPSRLCLGVPIAGTPVAPFFMQRVEHAMGPTPGDCRVPVALHDATGATRRTVMNNAGYLFICDDHPVWTDTSDDHVPAESTLMIPFAHRVHGAGVPRRERR